MTTIRGDKISAVDLSQVVMLNSYTSKKENVLTQEDGNGKNNEDNAKFVSWTLKCVREKVKLVEDTALKAVPGVTQLWVRFLFSPFT